MFIFIFDKRSVLNSKQKRIRSFRIVLLKQIRYLKRDYSHWKVARAWSDGGVIRNSQKLLLNRPVSVAYKSAHRHFSSTCESLVRLKIAQYFLRDSDMMAEIKSQRWDSLRDLHTTST